MGIFSNDDSGKYFDEASAEYKKYGEQALQGISRGKREGRGDITKGTEKGLGYQEPYIGAGKESLAALMSSLSLGPGAKGEQGIYDRFSTSPGYQFALKQGQQALQSQMAAKGLTGSGAEMMALQQQGQGMAQSEWDKYLKNYQDRLSELSGAGQRSALASSELSATGGRSLAQLGMGYTGMSTGVLQDIGKSSSEALMAKGVAASQENQAFWKGLGSVAGAGAKVAMM